MALKERLNQQKARLTNDRTQEFREMTLDWKIEDQKVKGHFNYLVLRVFPLFIKPIPVGEGLDPPA